MNHGLKYLAGLTAAALILLATLPTTGHSQVVNTTAKKRISIGFGLFSDIYMNTPAGMKTRTINQGVSVVGTYNVPFGKSNFGFGIGLGLTVHNLYWNYRYQADSLSFQFVKIEDTLRYKRSKVTAPYLEIPMEFRWKSKSKFTVAAGFKVGMLLQGQAKWVGDDYLFHSGNTLRTSFKRVKNLEKFAYGPTLRFGYKWINVNAYYSLSKVFQSGTGVDLYPVSVGIVLMPF
ncbi:MAG TPA: outer membrane beta-barrel protein [Bacteroidales bacterium]|nr:outer membrane beta-barrel protein [Bacteroidales bacterium]HPS63364.1 outer membrane beta-barrel protein [Bacteroidales bacterium]